MTINSDEVDITWEELVKFYRKHDCDILMAKLVIIAKKNIPRRGGFVGIRHEKERKIVGDAPANPDMYTCVPDAYRRFCVSQNILGHDGKKYTYAEAREQIPPCDADGNRELNDMFVLMKKHGYNAVDLKLGGHNRQFFTYTEGLCYFFIAGFFDPLTEKNKWWKTGGNQHAALFFPKTLWVVDGHRGIQLEEKDRGSKDKIQAMMRAKWGEEKHYTIEAVYEIKKIL